MELREFMGRILRFCLVVVAMVGWSGCSPKQGAVHGPGGIEDLSTGTGGGGGDVDMSAMMPSTDDGGTAYEFDFATSNTMCVPPQMGKQCPAPIGPRAGCKLKEDCGPDGSGNGLDDNCNDIIDEGCPCRPGAVEKCFKGPPGNQGVGGCTDGTSTCAGVEFGSWGPCVGSIGPSGEKCDNL